MRNSSEASFETGGRNALNLQMALIEEIREGVECDRGRCLTCDTIALKIDEFRDDARAASDGKEQGAELGKTEAQ